MKVKKQEKVKINEIEIYLKILTMDHQFDNNNQIAETISKEFNVDCTINDINKYYEMYINNNHQEDYEKLSRMIEYGNVEYYIE